MKKAITLILVLCLVAATLLGCASGLGGVLRAANESRDIAASADNDRPTHVEDASTPEAKKPPVEEKEEPAQASADGSYVRGTLTDTSFESEHLNLKFTVPDGFIMGTEDEILNMMDMGADILDLDQKMVDFAMISTVYEMLVSSPFGVPNLILMAEKQMLRNVTEDQYLEALKSQLVNVSGMDYQFDSEITDATIAGQKYRKLTTDVEAYGQAMIQDYIFRKLDDRMVGFIITYTEETRSEMEKLINSFTTFR